jgi:hypothetical protein
MRRRCGAYGARHIGHIMGDIHQCQSRFTAENRCPQSNSTPVRFRWKRDTFTVSANDKVASAMGSSVMQHCSPSPILRPSACRSACALNKYPQSTVCRLPIGEYKAAPVTGDTGCTCHACRRVLCGREPIEWTIDEIEAPSVMGVTSMWTQLNLNLLYNFNDTYIYNIPGVF